MEEAMNKESALEIARELDRRALLDNSNGLAPLSDVQLESVVEGILYANADRATLPASAAREAAEGWLARRGYSDSRPHSSTAIAELLEEYAAHCAGEFPSRYFISSAARAAAEEIEEQLFPLEEGYENLPSVSKMEAVILKHCAGADAGEAMRRACIEKVKERTPVCAKVFSKDIADAIQAFGTHLITALEAVGKEEEDAK